jgi:uncharacterized protein (DUF983 family)
MRLTSWQERRRLEPACRAPAGALAFARAQARAASFVLTAAGGSGHEASFFLDRSSTALVSGLWAELLLLLILVIVYS